MVFLYNFIGPGKVYNIYPHFPRALNTATFSSFYFIYINQRKVTLYVESILISHIYKCPLKQGGKEHWAVNQIGTQTFITILFYLFT